MNDENDNEIPKELRDMLNQMIEESLAQLGKGDLRTLVKRLTQDLMLYVNKYGPDLLIQNNEAIIKRINPDGSVQDLTPDDIEDLPDNVRHIFNPKKYH